MLEQSFSNSSYFFPRLPGNKLVAVNPNRKTKKQQSQQSQQQKLRHSNEMLTTNEAISEEFLDNGNELYKSEMDFKGYSINLLNQKAHDMEMMEMSKISRSLFWLIFFPQVSNLIVCFKVIMNEEKSANLSDSRYLSAIKNHHKSDRSSHRLGVLVLAPDGELVQIGKRVRDTLKVKSTTSNVGHIKQQDQDIVYRLYDKIPPYLYYTNKIDQNVSLDYSDPKKSG